MLMLREAKCFAQQTLEAIAHSGTARAATDGDAHAREVVGARNRGIARNRMERDRAAINARASVDDTLERAVSLQALRGTKRIAWCAH